MSRIALFVPSTHLRGGGEKYGLSIASALMDSHDVTIYTVSPDDLAPISRFLGVDVSRCTHVTLSPTGPWWLGAAHRLHAPREVLSRLYALSYRRQMVAGHHDLFINASDQSRMTSAAPIGVSVCMFPVLPPRLTITGGHAPWFTRTRTAGLDRLPGSSADVRTSYDEVWAISTFTREWLDRWWPGAVTQMLFPPCEDMSVPGVEQERLILSTGRFIGRPGGSLHKKQDVLVRAFAELTDLHDAGWRLLLMGSRHPGPETAESMVELHRLAAGLPVDIIEGAPFDELRLAYNRASLYWHAMGYGTAPGDAPHSQEHFGMTTVEAMSAGAVPVVHGGAGARDTVRDGTDGRVWHTVPELIAATRELATDDAAMHRLSEAARAGSARFGAHTFADAVRERVRHLLGARADNLRR